MLPAPTRFHYQTHTPPLHLGSPPSEFLLLHPNLLFFIICHFPWAAVVCHPCRFIPFSCHQTETETFFPAESVIHLYFLQSNVLYMVSYWSDLPDKIMVRPPSCSTFHSPPSFPHRFHHPHPSLPYFSSANQPFLTWIR